MEQMASQGLVVRGELHSEDASGGEEIPLYTSDGDLRTLGASERLIIDSIVVHSVAGGDTYVFFDADDDDALDDGETVVRADLEADGRIAQTFPQHSAPTGPKGAKPHAISPQGMLDVTLTGRIVAVIDKSGPVGVPA